MSKTVGILGAGSWGTALAVHLGRVGHDVRLWARDRNEIVTNNLTSTRVVMEEALRAGVERIVYTSSVATLAVRRDGRERRSGADREAGLRRAADSAQLAQTPEPD